MADLLVKLYDMKNDWTLLFDQEKQGINIRKPVGPEKNILVDWVREKFEDAWASEMDMAISNRPISCFVAIKNKRPVGFACYDATALGYFGPTGVEEASRGLGTGRALLLACLLDMKLKGYGYAIIGDAGPVDFYQKTVGAIVIKNSKPGILSGFLQRKSKKE